MKLEKENIAILGNSKGFAIEVKTAEEVEEIAKRIETFEALVEALETIHANAAESPEWIRRHTDAALASAKQEATK